MALITQQECEGSGGHVVPIDPERGYGTVPCDRCGVWVIVSGEVPGQVRFAVPPAEDAPATDTKEAPAPKRRRRGAATEAS